MSGEPLRLHALATAVRQWSAVNDGWLNPQQVAELIRALDVMETAKAEEALNALEEGHGIVATCVRSGDWWAITVPGVEGGYTQARSLDEALEMVADLKRLSEGSGTTPATP